MKHTIAIIDSGGRGSVLAYHYAMHPQIERIVAIPGNDSMQMMSRKPMSIYPNLKTTDVTEILSICKKEHVSYVDVAQDNAIAVGLVDALQKNGIPAFGPTQKAGELEWNKAYAREFMKKYSIPQPEFYIFTSQSRGIAFLSSQKDQPWFVKASGLAEGKGALPARNNKEAIRCIKELSRFGKSGKTYLLEKWLRGESTEEFSAFFLCDGTHAVFLGAAQDHKRALTFDMGENTGGMGCVSNPSVMTPLILKQVLRVAKKTIDGMRDEGRAYKGILYIGGMVIDGKDIYVIEYNARWGDPEAQVIIPGLQSNLFDLSMDSLSGNVSQTKIKVDKRKRVVITGAAKGYPLDYLDTKGKEIYGFEMTQKKHDVLVFGAGMKQDGPKFLVNGGRLFYVVSEGKNILEAREKGYKAMSDIFIEGNNLYYRIDIGYRDVERIYKR